MISFPEMKARIVLITTIAALAAIAAVSYLSDNPVKDPGAATPARIRFSDVTAAAGITFRHESGARGKGFNPETFGPGAGWLDHDGDGLLAILLVNGNLLDSSPDD